MKLAAPLRYGVLAGAMLAAWILAGCQKHETAANPNVDYYTCTMHPFVHSHDPNAKCPICSMDLVPVMRKGVRKDGEHPANGIKAIGGALGEPEVHEFMVPVERQQQIGVTYAPATKRHLHRDLRAVGKVVVDQTRHWEFAARVEGYVQKLNVTSPGELIEAGQPLLSIYSPDLLTAEKEFVSLLDNRDHAATPEAKADAARLLSAARFRLEQWNVMPRQIAGLEKTRTPSEYLTLLSPFKGVVEEVPVEQGRRVLPGDHLVEAADLSVVWVWADFYEDELATLATGAKTGITTPSYPGQRIEGRINLVDPFLNDLQRTTRVRIEIPNPDLRLRPGMYVNVELEVDMGEGLAIPVSAVMPTGSRALVFVDKGLGKLEPRFIQLRGQVGEVYAVKEGLKESERVVASANFLIDAESKVQGAVKSFEEPSVDHPRKTNAK